MLSREERHESRLMFLTPGKVVDCLANHIASLRSKLGSLGRHQIGRALSGKKRFVVERLEEVEAIAAELGYEMQVRVNERVETLLKD